jgi:hypothetical protein
MHPFCKHTSHWEQKHNIYFLYLQYSFVTPVTSLVVVKPNSSHIVGSEVVQPEEGKSLPPLGIDSLHVWVNFLKWHSWQPTEIYLY